VERTGRTPGGDSVGSSGEERIDARETPLNDYDALIRRPHSECLVRDGRRVAYVEFGDPAGQPTFFFHGLPSSRLAAVPLHAAAERRSIRLIALDRPGYGHSDFSDERTLLSWPDDVADVADGLNIERFSIVSVSAGMPYAAACALKLGDRLDWVAAPSSAGRVDAPEALEGMSKEARFLYGVSLKSQRLGKFWMRLLSRTPTSEIVKRQIQQMSEADQAILRRPEVRAHREIDLKEAFRQGPGAAMKDGLLHLDDWGFEAADVEFPIDFWHGEHDRTHPIAWGRLTAASFSNARTHVVDDGGFMWFTDHMDEIFESVTAASSPDGSVTVAR
jgi:pimeloyl-ACP methyl ester carboxylesterase